MTTRREQRRVNERLEMMRDAKRGRMLVTYNNHCPTCFAEPGEKCITRNGKRTHQHITRNAQKE